MDVEREAIRSLVAARDGVYWLAEGVVPVFGSPLSDHQDVDLVIVGAGFLGLWSAILIKERFPEWEIVVVDGGRVGFGASGRNGGFVDASLTHGLENGLGRWPEDIEELERLGGDNLTALAEFIERHSIDCDFERSGSLDIATERWQLDGLEKYAETARRYGHDAGVLDRNGVQELVRSPLYQGGLWTTNRTALVNPARLAWGLARVAIELGVTIHEGTVVTSVHDVGGMVEVDTAQSGSLRAAKVILATNAFPPLLSGVASFIVPVYDYVLMTEPLSSSQLEEIGWRGRQGLSDLGNLFHYYRLTSDNRILWGGYDAIYHYGSRVSTAYRLRSKTHLMLARHFFETFPMLEGIRFTHAWGGAIDTSTRFSMFFGSRYQGKVHYALGFTGLGVGATRFAAQVLCARMEPKMSPFDHLGLVRTKPMPFPPEPLRSLAVAATRRSLMRADTHGGHRNLWLRTLDRLGVGFDS
ncbi:NAD(P)/FAD-dependent oxidoreductase [Ferrimicrobium acidiphilum]|uniref:Gamma-glutamylputrescine oxidoreductase n=1 Tax=Ferrimicrobium acidiphilum DSM 19497 TaxID=1121877 RepID=A0A0D8FXG9_9ACTN|nr:FAD-dependent oxidoreductase [Ferrimicrobium acidiphilum]KJE77836.1 gamma-glutamylputrescine oxidoreductase [Ferrimicrobium acidiphilum DSM 19497]